MKRATITILFFVIYSCTHRDSIIIKLHDGTKFSIPKINEFDTSYHFIAHSDTYCGMRQIIVQSNRNAGLVESSFMGALKFDRKFEGIIISYPLHFDSNCGSSFSKEEWKENICEACFVTKLGNQDAIIAINSNKTGVWYNATIRSSKADLNILGISKSENKTLSRKIFEAIMSIE